MAGYTFDGFDQYGTIANMKTGQTGWVTLDGSLNTNSAFVRTGTTSYQCSNNITDYTMPSSNSQWCMGMAVLMTGSPVASDFLDIYNPAGLDSGNLQCIIKSLLGGYINLTVNGVVVATSQNIVFYPNQYQYIEVDFFCDPVAGYVRVYREGVLMLNYTGNTNGNPTNHPTPVPSFVRIFMHYGVANLYLDDFYTSTGIAPYGPIRCYTQVLNADTAQKDWTLNGGATGFGILSTIPQNMAVDFLSAAAAGNTSNFGITDLPLTVSSISGVTISTYQGKSDAGIATTKMGMISGASTGYGATNSIPLNGGYIVDTFNNDPATSAPWTVTGFNAALFTAVRVS